jgi:hypothetical protein
MERRTFLKRGLLGGALLAVGGAGGLALWPGDRSARPLRELAVISADSFPVLVAVAARVCRGTTARPIEIAHRVDDALRFTFPEAQQDINSVFGLLENAVGGLLLRGSARPFTLLDGAGQDAALDAWRDSDLTLLRGAYHALRKLCLAAHYASPGSWAEVAYGGPLIPKAAPPPITATGSLVVDGARAEELPQ